MNDDKKYCLCSFCAIILQSDMKPSEGARRRDKVRDARLFPRPRQPTFPQRSSPTPHVERQIPFD